MISVFCQRRMGGIFFITKIMRAAGLEGET